ncbi:unnamed protein product, partial [Trichobilharzia regenti]
RQIHSYLDRHVIGQEKAKRILAVQVYAHYNRIQHNRSLTAASESATNDATKHPVNNPFASGYTPASPSAGELSAPSRSQTPTENLRPPPGYLPNSGNAHINNYQDGSNPVPIVSNANALSTRPIGFSCRLIGPKCSVSS